MIVTIQDNFGNSAAVSTFGAELKSFRTGGMELIWQSDKTYWDESAPLLFPIASNVRNNTVYIEGRPYHLPPHGFAKKLEWTVSERKNSSVALTLHETPETLAMYPFCFTLTANFSLKNAALEFSMEIRNDDNREMPYCFGTHPAFNVPFIPHSDSKFPDHCIRFEKKEQNSCPIYDSAARQINIENRESFLETDEQTLPLHYDIFERIDTVIFDHMNSRKAELIDKISGHKIILEYPDFEYFAVWTKKGAPYICMEPWQGLTTCSDEDDNFLSKRGVRRLNPGCRHLYHLRFSLEN